VTSFFLMMWILSQPHLFSRDISLIFCLTSLNPCLGVLHLSFCHFSYEGSQTGCFHDLFRVCIRWWFLCCSFGHSISRHIPGNPFMIQDPSQHHCTVVHVQNLFPINDITGLSWAWPWSIIAVSSKGYLAVTAYSVVSVRLVSLCKPSHWLPKSLQFGIEYFFVCAHVNCESHPVSISFLPCHCIPKSAIFSVRSICPGYVLPFCPFNSYLVCLVFIGVRHYFFMEGFAYFQEALLYLVSIQVTDIFQSWGSCQMFGFQYDFSHSFGFH
jgi:hypothetical protein